MYQRPSDAAIAEAQAAYDRGELTLLEATFLADALSDMGPQDRDADTLHWKDADGTTRERRDD